jgi:hypothetical protein
MHQLSLWDGPQTINIRVGEDWRTIETLDVRGDYALHHALRPNGTFAPDWWVVTHVASGYRVFMGQDEALLRRQFRLVQKVDLTPILYPVLETHQIGDHEITVPTIAYWQVVTLLGKVRACWANWHGVGIDANGRNTYSEDEGDDE